MSGLQDPAISPPKSFGVELHPDQAAMHLLKVFKFVEGILGDRATSGAPALPDVPQGIRKP
jgi:hypothetical protein